MSAVLDNFAVQLLLLLAAVPWFTWLIRELWASIPISKRRESP